MMKKDGISIRIFARRNVKTTDYEHTYRLTSTEEPSDEVLSQLMREAAEDAARTNAEATTRCKWYYS